MTMQFFKSITSFVIVIAVLAGCASMKIGSHQDESASLEGYRTFTWITDDPLILAAGDQVPISPLSKKKIVDGIATTLTDKGYSFTSNRSDADFVVSYTVGTREKIDASAYPSGYSGAWGWHLHGRNYYQAEVRHRSYTEGTLGIDIFDGRTNQPVWHGWASKTISASDRDDPSSAITRAVQGILEQFPCYSE